MFVIIQWDYFKALEKAHLVLLMNMTQVTHFCLNKLIKGIQLDVINL